MVAKAKTEPDYIDLCGVRAPNVDTCPVCDGEGVADRLITQPRRASVLVTGPCECCGGDGLAFPSEVRSYTQRCARQRKAA